MTLGFILFLLDSVSGHPMTMQQVFSPNALRVHSIFGAVTVFAHLLNAVAGSATTCLFSCDMLCLPHTKSPHPSLTHAC